VKVGKPEIQPQRRKNDENEIGQRHHEGQRLGRTHRLHLQIQRNGGQAGFNESAEIAARVGHVTALLQPRVEHPQHRQFEQHERYKDRSQRQDREMTVPDPLDGLRPDRIGHQQGYQQHGEGAKDRLHPEQFGSQDFAGQSLREIGRYRGRALTVLFAPS